MPLDRLTEQMLPAIEQALRQAMAAAEDEYAAEMYEMLAYHLGWSGEDAGEKARGKRIRPLLVTLTTVGGRRRLAACTSRGRRGRAAP